MKIGIFDSGIGGLNVLKEVIKKYPNNSYYYYGDTKNIPYGEKDKETLIKLASNIIKFFEEKKVDIIIIACGTVSSNCFLELKKITKIPLYDIISPTIEYLKKKDSSKIAVFATKKTIESHVFKNSLENVVELATPEFVPMIEEKKVDDLIVKNYTSKINDSKILVLGCTHYPLLIKEFKKYLSREIEIVDMGVCLSQKIKLSNNEKQEINLFFTKIDSILEKNVQEIMNCQYNINLIES